jgi:hypothetical protein
MPYFLRRGLGAYSPQVQSIAQAFAFAEGFNTAGPNSAPVRNNNPCDLGGAGASFPTLDAGWNACYGQVNAMLSGSSSYYSPSDSISQIAPTYTGNDNASSWAAAVAQSLGVPASTPLNQIGVSSGVPAQTPVDSSTGLPAASTGGFDLSTLFSPSGDSGSSGITLLDSSGNLTGWAWAGIVAGVGLLVWAVVK